MNCEWVKTNGVLFVYDELADDARHELEQHLAKCEDCAQEVAELKSLHTALKTLPAAEPNASMLAASRMRLQEALESAEQERGWSRWTVDVAGWFQAMRFSPALAGVLLMAGFAGGIFASYGAVKKQSPGVAINGAGNTDQASIANISGISQDPNDHRKVEIKYNKLVPDTAQGSIDDPRIQQLLLYAARSNYNSGVRLDSIDVLTQKPEDARIREALIYALRYDKNPGVRLKALESLRPYVKSDIRVRDAMLEALVRDGNSGVRTEAIRSLDPVTTDTSVRQTLLALSNDSNDYIRSESKRVLETLPRLD